MSDPNLRIPDHSLNAVKNRLEQVVENLVALNFATIVTTTSKYVEGAGRMAGDGYPMPYDGEIIGISCWDGTGEQNDITTIVPFSAGDRISCYANYPGASPFIVIAYKNGLTTASQTSGLASATLFVTIFVRLKIPYI